MYQCSIDHGDYIKATIERFGGFGCRDLCFNYADLYPHRHWFQLFHFVVGYQWIGYIQYNFGLNNHLHPKRRRY